MTVRERILALRLMERQERDPAYMKQLGISTRLEHRPTPYQDKEGEKRNVTHTM